MRTDQPRRMFMTVTRGDEEKSYLVDAIRGLLADAEMDLATLTIEPDMEGTTTERLAYKVSYNR